MGATTINLGHLKYRAGSVHTPTKVDDSNSAKNGRRDEEDYVVNKTKSTGNLGHEELYKTGSVNDVDKYQEGQTYLGCARQR